MISVDIHDVSEINLEDIDEAGGTIWRTIKIRSSEGEIELNLYAANDDRDNLCLIHRDQVIRENDR